MLGENYFWKNNNMPVFFTGIEYCCSPHWQKRMIKNYFITLVKEIYLREWQPAFVSPLLWGGGKGSAVSDRGNLRLSSQQGLLGLWNLSERHPAQVWPHPEWFLCWGFAQWVVLLHGVASFPVWSQQCWACWQEWSLNVFWLTSHSLCAIFMIVCFNLFPINKWICPYHFLFKLK